jgi:methyltransferase-like protein
MPEKEAYSYDEIPYPSYAYPQAHPDHLATLAALSGMSPAPVEKCRVLELGCNAGGNLIPMAYGLPEGEFVGVELSNYAIGEARKLVSELGLKNVNLSHLNILDIGADFGRFDYIIAYGTYSWVPRLVQDKILEICREFLAPNGVAYISYNAYPGWRMHYIMRDMIFYHNRQESGPQPRLDRARAWADFMVKSIQDDSALYSHFLRDMQSLLQSSTDGYLYHDLMEEENEPLYFYQFIERARRHGLQYLGNAEFANSATNLPAEVIETVLEMTEDIIEIEQYLDFLVNRTFRETVLCHQEIPLSRTLTADRLEPLYVVSRVAPETSELDLQSTQTVVFRGPDGTALSTAHPLTKAALTHLAEVWPRAVPFNTLVAAARSLLDSAAGAEIDADALAHEVSVLGNNLLQAYSQNINLIGLHSCLPHFVLEISERPIASPIARFQQQNGLPVTNMYHYRVTLGEISGNLIGYVDGSRDRAALLDILTKLKTEGILTVEQDGQPVEEAGLVKQALVETLDSQLHQMAQAALLVG